MLNLISAGLEGWGVNIRVDLEGCSGGAIFTRNELKFLGNGDVKKGLGIAVKAVQDQPPTYFAGGQRPFQELLSRVKP